MNSDLQIFYREGNQIRTIEDNGEIWFVAKDIALALEYSEGTVNNAINSLMQSVPEIWKDKKRIFATSDKTTARPYQDVLCLTEQGLYFFLGRSDKPKALPYQMWIAGDVVPSIRKTGSYSIKDTKASLPSGIIDGAKIIFEAAGITGNQLALALDKTARHYTGESMLALGEVELKAPTQKQLLTPTQIGKHFGLSAREVNNILAGAGFQHKINNMWEPLEPGSGFAVMVDAGKSRSNGTPVRQLKWDSSILDEFENLYCEDVENS